MENTLKVFIIPSWYPTNKNPIAGIFFREQAVALAESHLEIKVFVSAIHLYQLTPRNLTETIKNIFKFILDSTSESIVSSRLIEVKSVALSWTDKLFNGNLNRQFNIHERNFLRAINLFGGIDIIHAHSISPGGYIAKLLSEKYKIPYVITEHVRPDLFGVINGKVPLKTHQAIQNASAFFAVSPSLSKEIRQLGYKNVNYLPNMVNESIFKPKAFNTENGDFVFCTVSRMVSGKGIDDLLHAIHKVTKKNENITFKIGGDGPKFQEFIRLANQLGISNQINWLGNLSREGVLSAIQDSHAFVLPSHYETFGVVYAEAIACGKPIIATKCGGSECIVNKTNGVLINVSDVNALADAINNVVDNIDNFDSTKIREDFLNRFSFKKVIGDLYENYQRVINQG